MATSVCSLGPECENVGVQEEVLLSYVSLSQRQVSVPQVRQISNGLLLELSRMLAPAIKEKFKARKLEIQRRNEESLHESLKRKRN